MMKVFMVTLLTLTLTLTFTPTLAQYPTTPAPTPAPPPEMPCVVTVTMLGIDKIIDAGTTMTARNVEGTMYTTYTCHANDGTYTSENTTCNFGMCVSPQTATSTTASHQCIDCDTLYDQHSCSGDVLNSTVCASKKHYDCYLNPVAMIQDCCSTCKDVTCMDNNLMCTTWASEGECVRNQGYMWYNCCPACKQAICDDSYNATTCANIVTNGQCPNNLVSCCARCQNESRT